MPPPRRLGEKALSGVDVQGAWRSAGRRTTGGLGCRPAANWRTRAALRSMFAGGCRSGLIGGLPCDYQPPKRPTPILGS